MYTFGEVTIRLVEEADLENMRTLRNDQSTWSMLTDPGWVDAEGQRRWFQTVRTARDKRYYVICDELHEFVGIVRTDEIDRQNRSIRVGADIVPPLRGRGYGARTYALLKKYCFDILNMHRVWLAVLATNETAVRLYERQGFREEGRYREAIFRDGRYHDYIVMSILEDEYRCSGSAKEREK